MVLRSFLWNLNHARKNDKIWGHVSFDGKSYQFWGRRATDESGLKRIRFKRNDDLAALKQLCDEKIRKGYVAQDIGKQDDEYPGIEKIYPGFVKHMRNELMMARLSGTVASDV
jgi:predicted DNA-binding WGR domain protein